MDGRNALPDPKAERGECGDELECARLQLETGDKNHRYRRLVEGDGGVKATAFTAPRGAKAFHKRSDALSKLIVANARENASLRSAALRNPGYVNVFTHSGPTPARCAVGYAAAKRPFDSKKSQPHITAMTSPPKRFVLCHCSALVVTPPKLRHSIKP